MKVGIVGGGVMGEAILQAALAGGVFDRDAVTVADVVAKRRQELASAHGVAVTESASEAVAGAALVLLCVKPQELGSVRGVAEPGAVVVSIIAGTKIATLQQALGTDRIVRVMPNTPAAIGAGMSAWTATLSVDEAQRATVRAVLAATGRELYVDDEKKIDMATAVNGSGPAFVFLFIEAMIDGAVSIGLPRIAAEELAIQTVLGSAQYALASDRPVAELRARVTSPAGTTAAGLLELEKGAVRAAVIEAVRAAHRRAVELGG